MRCIEAGGLEAVFNEKLDAIWQLTAGTDDYNPNPNGYYHSEDDQTDWPSFHRDHKGKVIKIPRADLAIVPRGKYKLVFMVRNPKEIIASMRKFSPYVSWGDMERNAYLYDIVKKATLDRIRDRGDYDILEVQYADVVENPKNEFEKIRDFGFPIDVEKAAAMVDPSLYRLRLERK